MLAGPIALLVALLLASLYTGEGNIPIITAPLIITLALLLWAVHQNDYRLRLPGTGSAGFYFSLFLLFASLSIFWSNALPASLFQLPILLSSLFVMLFVMQKDETTPYLFAVFAYGIVITAITLYQKYHLGMALPRGLMLNCNNNAALINIILFPLIAILLTQRKAILVGLLALLVSVFLHAHFLTLSRGAFGALLITLPLFFYIHRECLNRFNTAALVASIALAILTSTYLSDQTVFSHVAALEQSDRIALDKLSSGRISIWSASLGLYENHPWLGSGVGSYWANYPMVRPAFDASAAQHAHNDYLQILLELGPIGLAFFCVFLVTLFRPRSWRSKDPFATGLMLGVAAIFLHSAFTFNLYIYVILILVGLFLGLIHNGLHSENTLIVNLKTGTPRVLFFSVMFLITVLSSGLFFGQYYLGRAEQTSDFQESSQLLLTSLRFNPIQEVPHILLASNILDILDKEDSNLSADKEQQLVEYALSHLEMARSYMPTRWTNYSLTALFLQKKEVVDENSVTSNFEKALYYNPNYLEARIRYAQFLLKKDDITEALSILQGGMNRYYQTTPEQTQRYLRLYQQVLRTHGDKDHMIGTIASELNRANELVAEYGDNTLIYMTIGNRPQ